MQTNDRKDFQKEIGRLADITLAYYNKLDGADPWNSVYTNTGLLKKVIKPHTERVRQETPKKSITESLIKTV